MDSVDNFETAVDRIFLKLDETLVALQQATEAGSRLVDSLHQRGVVGRAGRTREVIRDINGATDHATALRARITAIRGAVDALN